MSEENKHTCDCGHDHMEEELDNIIILNDENGEEVQFEFFEESYVGVEDEETLNKVFEIFKEKFKDEFNYVEE